MKKKFLTKNLCIVVIALLVATLFYSEAFAWSGSHRRGNRGDRGWSRSYRSHYVRSYDSDFVGFQIVLTPKIGNIVLRLPIGYQTVRVKDVPYYYHDGIYYKECQPGYIIIPAPCH